MLFRFLSFYLIPFFFHSSIPTRISHSVQLLSCVQLFAIPWTAACQASLSITKSQSLLKLMFIESVMPSNCLILCHPFSSWLQPFSASGFLPKSQFCTSGGWSIGASASAVIISPWDSLLAFVIAEHKTLPCCLNYSQMFLTGIRKINIDKMCEDQGDKNKITYILYLYYICLTNSVPWLSLPGIFNMNWIYKSISVSRCITILKHKRSHVRRLCIWARKSQMRVFLSVSWRSNLAMFKPLTESANYILASRFIQKHHRKTGSSCKHS